MRRAEQIAPPPFHDVFGGHDSAISLSILVYVSSDWDATSIDLSVSVGHDIFNFSIWVYVDRRQETVQYGPATAIENRRHDATHDWRPSLLFGDTEPTRLFSLRRYHATTLPNG